MHPGFGIGAEEPRDVALNVRGSDAAAVFGQKAIAFGEDGCERPACVGPLVDDLFEDTRVGMLRDETCAEHFKTFASDLFDDGSIVHKPPATEGHEVIEFSREDAEFVLIFAAENADEKTVGRKITAKIFEGAQIGAADGVAGETDSRIDLFTDADHEGERQAQFAAGGENGVAEQQAI